MCSRPNINPDVIIYSLSCFINLLKQPLNIISSTIGAHRIAVGNVYNFGNDSNVSWLTVLLAPDNAIAIKDSIK